MALRTSLSLCCLALSCSIGSSRVLADDIDDAVAGMNDAAGQLLELKHYGEAEHAFRSALKYRPQDRTALKGLADTLTAEGKTQEAATYTARLGNGAATPDPIAQPPADAALPPPPLPAAPPPVEAAPVAPAALIAAPANVGTPLNGWCGYINVGPQGSVFVNFLGFTKQGYIYTGPPSGVVPLADLQRSDPEHFGTYSYDGKQLIITYVTGKTETRPFNGTMCDGGILQAAGIVKTGTTFEGTFSHSMNAMSFGGVTAMSGGTWHFHANGTFEHSGFSSAETTGTHHEANALGAGEVQASGHYAITDGVLSLNNGAETHKIAYLVDKNPPWYLAIDGETFRLQ